VMVFASFHHSMLLSVARISCGERNVKLKIDCVFSYDCKSMLFVLS
jgi:hypothetical protein